MNTTVTATGMQVKASTASSLVITDTAANINTTATNTQGMTANTSSLVPATHLIPATHSLTYTEGDSYLVYVSNPGDVDAVTGYAQSGKTLTYAKCVNADPVFYYIDYTVYIASKGAEITGQDLKATITPDTSKALYNAISIDYWLNDSYVVTDSFADAADAETVLSNGTIPSASAASNNYLTVKMRVYFDGALESGTAGTAYVNNGNVDVNAVTFSVAFAISSHA